VAEEFAVPLPIDRCVAVLRALALSRGGDEQRQVPSPETDEIDWTDSTQFWTQNLADLDVSSYGKDVTERVKQEQAEACVTILHTAALGLLSKDDHGHSTGEGRQDLEQICLALLFGCMIPTVAEMATSTLSEIILRSYSVAVKNSLVKFLAEPSSHAVDAGIRVLRLVIEAKYSDSARSSLDGLMSDFCASCCSLGWVERKGIQDSMLFLMDEMGSEWSQTFELEIFTAALMSVKSVPSELSCAVVNSLRFFIGACARLYGTPWRGGESEDDEEELWLFDVLLKDESKLDEARSNAPSTSVCCPSEDVVRMLLQELVSPQQIVR
jgi:hypothetical protein